MNTIYIIYIYIERVARTLLSYHMISFVGSHMSYHIIELETPSSPSFLPLRRHPLSHPLFLPLLRHPLSRPLLLPPPPGVFWVSCAGVCAAPHAGADGGYLANALR